MLARSAVAPLPQQPSVPGPQPACVQSRSPSRSGLEHRRGPEHRRSPFPHPACPVTRAAWPTATSSTQTQKTDNQGRHKPGRGGVCTKVRLRFRAAREMHRPKIAHLFYMRVCMCSHCLPVVCVTVEIEKPFRLWDMLDGPLEDCELSFEITHAAKQFLSPNPLLSLLGESRARDFWIFLKCYVAPLLSSGEVITR